MQRPMFSDDDFRMLLAHFDLPWAGYRKVRKGVKRRVRHHMQDLGCPDILSYLALVEERPDARERCRQCLLVTISRFFRDRRLWDHLQNHWLPALKKRYPQGLHAWSAGCAGGEEPYSLATLWAVSARDARELRRLRITATDASLECLERARRGIYDAGSLKEVPDDLRRRFFTPLSRHRWAIEPQLQELIEWELHDLLSGPPPVSLGPFHIVLLRNNLLTYYQGELQHRALEAVIDTIVPGGLLIVGSHERLPEISLPFIRDEASPWVYQLSGDAVPE